MLKIDLHTHSNFSDGYDEPMQVYQSAKEQGLDAFALTDHNTVAGLIHLMDQLRSPEKTLQLIPGLELSLLIGHFLILGIEAEKLQNILQEWRIGEATTAHPASYEQLQKYLTWVQEEGGVAIAAHPGIPSGLMSISKPRVLELYKDGLIQGAEAHNAQLQKTFGTWFYKAWHHNVSRFLAKHEIPAYAFSDSHAAERVAQRYTKVQLKKKARNQGLLAAMKSGALKTEWEKR